MAFKFGSTSGFGNVNNFGTGSFSSRFANPYKFSAGRVNSDTSNALFEAIRRREEAEFELTQERSMLDRVFDGLQIGNYTTANYASDWTKYAKGAEDAPTLLQAINPFDDIWSGIKASNPFGAGSEQDEKTFSNVLGEAGWNPTSLGGKIAKGTLGFAGDVLLDPTTYLSGGVGAVVKGTGRVGRATETLDALAKSLPKSITDGKEITHMTEEMASHIISKSGKETLPEQLAKDSKALADKYNKLLGIRDAGGGRSVTFGVENLPFGDKLAPKLGVFGKTLTLSDGTALRSLGDNIGTASAYAGLRNTIYGGKLGKLFSTTAPLKILADRNPAELYDFIKFIDTTKGKKLDKLQSDKAIRQKAKDLMGLTPAQHKEIITLLEDKTIWGKAKGILKLSETQKGKDLMKVIAKSSEEKDELLSDAEQVKVVFEALEQNKALTDAERVVLEELRSQVAPPDVKHIEKMKQRKERITNLQSERKSLESEQLLKSTKETFGEETVEAGTRLRKILEDSKNERESLNGEREMASILRERGISDKGLRENGTRLASRHALRDELSKYIYGDVSKLPTDFRDDAMEKIVQLMENADDGEKLLKLLKDKDSFFGKLMPKELSDFMDMINNGELPALVKQHILSNPHLFSEHANEVYRYLGTKYHYNSLDKDLREPIRELIAKSKSKEGLTKGELAKLKRMQKTVADRALDVQKFYRGMSHEEFKAFREAEEKEKLQKAFDEMIREPDEELRRARFIQEDGAGSSSLRDVVTPKYDKDGRIIGMSRRKEMPELRGRTGEFDEKAPLPDSIRLAKEEVDLMRQHVYDAFVKRKQTTKDSKTGVKKFNKKKKVTATEKDTQFLAIHEVAITDALKKLFPRSTYSELSTWQRDLVMRVSKGMAWEKFKNPKDAPEVLKQVEKRLIKESLERQEVARINELIKTVDVGKTVRVKDGDELIDATIISIEPNKVKKTRIESDPDGVVKRAMRPHKAKDGSIYYTRENVQPTKEVEYMDYDGTKSYVVRTASGEEKTINLADVKSVSNAKPKTMEQLREEVKLIEESAKRMEDAKKLVEEKTARMAELDKEIKRETKNMKQAEYRQKKKMDGILEELAIRADAHMGRIKELEDMNTQAQETLNALATRLSKKLGADVDVKDIDETIENIMHTKKALEDALQTDEALEAYVRLNMKDGDFQVRDALYQANKRDTVKATLSERASSKQIEETVKWLREEFNLAGADEVGIKKLSEEQFTAMFDRYVPHILTPDGERYFQSMKEITEHRASITQDLGYGVKWNPYKKSRTIQGKSIEEINEFFSEKLKGKNLFSENMADIYITRMLKHNELMYDHTYMKTMMDDFGYDIPDPTKGRKGYKAVANYGEVRELVTSITTSKLRDYIRELKPQSPLGDEEIARIYEGLLDETFSELRLPRSALDATATPMLELSSEQLKAIHQFGIAKHVNETIVHKANQARKLAMAKDESRALQLYDKFLHFIKLNQTTIMPSFHMRNKASNMFQGWLAVGRDSFNVKFQATAMKASMAFDDLDKLRALPPIVTDDGKRVYHWDEINDLALAHGARDEGFFAQDIGASTVSSGLLKNKINPKYNPTDTGNFIGYKVGTKVGTIIENSDRLLQFASVLKRGGTPEEAGEIVSKYLFDYADLTDFEKTVMKRIFPYYTWMRKNARLQVGEVIDQTEKYAFLPKIENGIEGMNNEEDQISEAYTTDFARDWIQTPFSNTVTKTLKDGTISERKEPLLLSPNMPYMDLARIPDPTQPLDSTRELIAQMAPQIKLPIELTSNKNMFFNSEIAETDVDGNELNPIRARLIHIVKQLAGVNAIDGVMGESGVDASLSALASLTGLKMTAYDYESSKGLMMAEQVEKWAKEDEERELGVK